MAGGTRPVAVSWEGVSETFRLEGPGVARRVPAARVSLSGGGWRGDAVHLTWEEDGRTWAVTVDDPAATDALLRALPSTLARDAARLRREAGRRRRQRTVALGLVAVLVLLPVAAAVALYLFREPILDAAVARMPVAVDVKLGGLVADQLAASGRVVGDGPAVEAVRAIGERLAGSAPSPFAFRFVVVSDATVNAFAAPGGLVAVHTGLIARAESSDELAGVVAHEIGHVLARHSLRQMLFELGLLASIRLLVGLEGLGDAVASGALQLGALRFSRDQERDADRRAVELLARARLPATGLGTFFAGLAAEPGGVPAIVSTHPPGAERSAALAALLEARGAWPVEPLALDWDAIRRDARARGA